jgi:hypothetical protein
MRLIASMWTKDDDSRTLSCEMLVQVHPTACADDGRNPARGIHSHAVDLPQLSGYTLNCESGSSSVVECFLAKEDVAGSTPVSRSKQYPSTLHFLCINGLQEFLGL